MAFSASGIFREFVTEALANAVAFDLSGTGIDGFKAALYNNTGTPDKDAAGVLADYNGTASAWVVANEQTSSTQWPATGIALVAPTLSNPSSGVVQWGTSTNTAGSGNVTLSGVMGCLVYDTTLTNQGICFNYFGGAQSVTAGTFTIVWSANGLFRITV